MEEGERGEMSEERRGGRWEGQCEREGVRGRDVTGAGYVRVGVRQSFLSSPVSGGGAERMRGGGK